LKLTLIFLTLPSTRYYQNTAAALSQPVSHYYASDSGAIGTSITQVKEEEQDPSQPNGPDSTGQQIVLADSARDEKVSANGENGSSILISALADARELCYENA